MNISEIEAREREVLRLDRIRANAMKDCVMELENGDQRRSWVDKAAIRKSAKLRAYQEEGGYGQEMEIFY